MKTRHALVLTFLLWISSFPGFAQDIIYKTSGEEINAKVLEINPSRIIFRQPALFGDSLLTLARQEVFMVKFANGAKELMQSPGEETAPSAPGRTAADLMQQGRLDAKRYYTGQKGLVGGALAGVLFFPALVVIAAVPPTITMKDGPDGQLLANPYYYKGFRGQAHKRKVGKVALGGGIALATMLVVSSLAAYSQ